jgi:hypothetical protein
MNIIQSGCAAVFLTASILAAQPAADWNIIMKLPPGEQVRVEATSRKLNGQLQSVSDDMIVVRSGAGEETLMRPEVTRIALKKPGHRKRNTFVGLAAGAGLGLAIALVSTRTCAFAACFDEGTVMAATPPAVAGLGAVVGAAIPTGGWREIYRQK